MICMKFLKQRSTVIRYLSKLDFLKSMKIPEDKRIENIDYLANEKWLIPWLEYCWHSQESITCLYLQRQHLKQYSSSDYIKSQCTKLFFFSSLLSNNFVWYVIKMTWKACLFAKCIALIIITFNMRTRVHMCMQHYSHGHVSIIFNVLNMISNSIKITLLFSFIIIIIIIIMKKCE